MTVERVERWSGATGLALVLAAVGIVTTTPALVVAATVPLWFVAYAAFSGPPPGEIELTRTIDGDVTAPGELATVRLAVENVGGRPIPDLRVIDGVPDELPVVEGSPRACLALDGGESETIEYAVRAHRGEHAFDPATVRARNVAGTVRRTETIPAAGERELACRLPVEDVPLGSETIERAGRVPSDEGGSGIEFHSIREYRRGDPIRSVDWRRYARTGDLTTVEYRVEQAANVVLLVDTRSEAIVAPDAESPSTLALSTDAAERAAEALVSADHPVGLATTQGDEGSVVAPDTGAALLERIRSQLAALRGDDGRGVRPHSVRRRSSSSVRRLVDRLPGEAQILLFTPAVDDGAAEIARSVSAHGYPVTVVSPDPTDRGDAATDVSAVARHERLHSLRGDGVRVVDWPHDRPLALVLGRALDGGVEA